MIYGPYIEYNGPHNLLASTDLSLNGWHAEKHSCHSSQSGQINYLSHKFVSKLTNWLAIH